MNFAVRHAGKKHCGSDIVGRGIVRQVIDIYSKAYFRCQMNNTVDPRQSLRDRIIVAHIGGDEFDIRRRPPRFICAVNVDPHRIHNTDLMAAPRELAQNMLTNESGAAGEQNAHHCPCVAKLARA
ncbi:hypothetical protein FHS46_003206 [Variibacter gotjawalensis]|nr:hypothetical protein [Variibacter gotjawalensis]